MQAAMIKKKAVLCDGDLYLRLDRVLAGAKEHLDTQVPLDPLEEQFDLPAPALRVSNQLRLQGKVVGHIYQALSRRVILHHPVQRHGVILARKIGLQYAGLVAHHHRVDSIHRMRAAPFERGVALVSGHKEGLPARMGNSL